MVGPNRSSIPTSHRAIALLLMTLSQLQAQPASDSRMTLVKDGAARAVIVVPLSPAPEVERGARELQQVIREMTGATLAIAGPDAAANMADVARIHLGLNQLLPAGSIDLSRCEKDGAWIKTVTARDLVIAGKTPYGTEFGVYGFLQDACGVRWYLPGPNGTFIPRRQTLDIPAIDKLDNPRFISRNYSAPTYHSGVDFPCLQAQDMDLAWYRHNRMRKHLDAHHNLGHIIVPSTFRDEHPEYFPEIGGKRKLPQTDRIVAFQPCMTNDEVVHLCVQAAAERFGQDADALSYSIGINDHGGFCECADCRALNGPPRLNSRGLPDFGRLYLHFGNQVARGLPPEFSDRYVGLIAYAQARDLPEDMDIHPNLYVGRVTAFTPYFSPMDRADMQPTRSVASRCRMMGVYDYWYGIGYAIPVFCVGLMEEYIDFLANCGVRSWDSETFQNWAMDGIKYYLLSRKLWTPSLRVAELLEEFCTHMFGAGAADMLEFYDLCRRRWETQRFATSKYHLQGSGRQVLLFDPDTCAQVLRLLQAARRKATRPEGQFLLEQFTRALTYTQAQAQLLRHSLTIADGDIIDLDAREQGPHREEDVIPGHGYQPPVDDMEEYAGHVLAALRELKRIEETRDALRGDAFSLPRRGLGVVDGMFANPETIAAPFLLACAQHNGERQKTAFLETVAADFPESFPRIAWVDEHLAAMDSEPELLPNGSFEELAANRYDAQGWLHGNWGSKRSTANAFVVPQGIDGARCYYLVGIKNTFTYLPYPVIKLAEEIPVEAGKWYMMRAKVRSHRNDGLLPAPAFFLQFPGATPGTLSCDLAPGLRWYDAVWLVRTPQKAKSAIVRFNGKAGEGQIWVDAISLKRVPDPIAPDVDDGPDKLAVYPALEPAATLPPALIVDLRADLPQGVFTCSNPIRDGAMVEDDGYVAMHVLWPFRQTHDVEFRVQASGADGAAIGAFALEEAPAAGNRWVTVGRCAFDPFRRPLTSAPTPFVFRYTYREPTRRLRFLLYRANREGTLRIHHLEAVPVAREQ